jgi:hypothetical protein
MAAICRDGVRLGFDDVEERKSLVLVHGRGCNRKFFATHIVCCSRSAFPREFIGDRFRRRDCAA